MSIPKNVLRCLLIGSVLSLFAIPRSARLPVQTKPLVNVDANRVGIHGYDPVSYFVDGKPAKGNPQRQSTLGGATYYFQSNAKKAAFDKEPSTYAPQHRGYCAMAMTMGKQHIDPNQFLVLDRKRSSNETRGRT